MSLQEQLEEIIKRKKRISYDNFKYEIDYGSVKKSSGARYKLETATRKMRLSKKVKGVPNEKGEIIAYEWIATGIEKNCQDYELYLTDAQHKVLEHYPANEVEFAIARTQENTWVKDNGKYAYILAILKNNKVEYK